MAAVEVDTGQIVAMGYTNYRGETAIRRILPMRVWFGSSEWHPAEQWLLDALDVEKNVVRSFALADIGSWRPDVSK